MDDPDEAGQMEMTEPPEPELHQESVLLVAERYTTPARKRKMHPKYNDYVLK